MNNVKKAFSLVEAMIILMLISVAIMAIVPLISQKSSSTGLQVFKGREGDDAKLDFMIFGKSPKQKLGIGLNPMDVPTVNAKLYANNIGINYTANSAISLGRGIVAAVNPYSFRAPVDDSIIIGQNACTKDGGSASAISIGSQNAACASKNLFIGQNATTNIHSDSDTHFSLNVNGQELIKLNGNDFTISHYNSGGVAKIFLYVEDGKVDKEDKKEIPPGEKPLFQFGKNVTIGDKDLYLMSSAYNAFGFPTDDDLDYPVDDRYNIHCSPEDHASCDVNTYTSFAINTKGLSFINSDKRLKNIIANYNKGIDDINKIDTYTYTYKDDKKKSLQVGLIAQKIAGIFDEALHVDANGFYSYERTPILYAMVNSVKTISHRIDTLNKEQKSLNSRADKLLKMYK